MQSSVVKEVVDGELMTSNFKTIHITNHFNWDRLIKFTAIGNSSKRVGDVVFHEGVVI